MERLALRKSLDFLLPNLRIVELTTDASTSIISMMGERGSCLHGVCLRMNTITYYTFLYTHVARDYPMIFHSLDVWHKAKKLKKALEEVIYTEFLQ